MVQFCISNDNGINWTPIEGLYTNLGSDFGGVQIEGEPVYDGSSNWVKENISLFDYEGENVLFKFELASDGYVEGDGFYFDDFQINSVILEEESSTQDFQNSDIQIYPNPVKNELNISKYNSLDYKYLEIYNITGNLIITSRLDDNLTKIATSNLQSGVYFIKISGNKVYTQKFIIN